MSISYKILPEQGLVYVQYSGIAGVRETREAFEDFARHPDFRPDLKHLIDVSRIDGFEQDFVELMEFQARALETLEIGDQPSIVVYYAPTQVGLNMAQSVAKSWKGLKSIILRIVADEAEALAILGLRHQTLADLPVTSE